jgi:two-component system sensor histidine kinase RegB
VTAENHRKRGATVRLTLPLATLAIGGSFDA